MSNKFSKAALVQWSGGNFGIGGIISREHQILTGTIVHRSASDSDRKLPAGFTITLIELRRSIGPKEIEGIPFSWAIFHWLGTASNPNQRAYSALFLPQDTTQASAEKEWQRRAKLWRTTGGIVTEKDDLTRDNQHTPSKSKSGAPSYRELLAEKDLSEARLRVSAQSFPETVKAMREQGNSGLAFEYEYSKQTVPADLIDTLIASNWPAWSKLTEREIADEVLKATGQQINPRTLTKRRERLGLTTQRPTGPRPKTEL